MKCINSDEYHILLMHLFCWYQFLLKYQFYHVIAFITDKNTHLNRFEDKNLSFSSLKFTIFFFTNIYGLDLIFYTIAKFCVLFKNFFCFHLLNQKLNIYFQFFINMVIYSTSNKIQRFYTSNIFIVINLFYCNISDVVNT